MSKRRQKKPSTATRRPNRDEFEIEVIPFPPLPPPPQPVAPAFPPVLAVGFGGAIGAVARYGVGELLDRPSSTAFPWSTLAVNLAGSFLIMLFVSYDDWRTEDTPRWEAVYLFVVTGLLGGFTTFSALSFETAELLRGGAWPTALAYVALTLIGGIALGIAGYHFGRRWQLRN